ncbi:Retrovirus-related Pol poly from transposon, partial [Aduncisulcus paluster]
LEGSKAHCTKHESLYSPVVIVPKKNGKKRLCIDYRVLNSITVPFQFPLPRIDEILDSLEGRTVFGTLDFSNGFHLIPIDPDCQLFTAFRTPDGIFQFTCMPFGLMNAPAHFQYIIQSVFGDLMEEKRCVIYMDDILVVGSSEEEFLYKLEIILDRCAKKGLSINFEKCFLGFEEVEFLGYTISGAGKQIAPGRISSIENLRTPSS